MQAFARAARARQLSATNNRAYARMRHELFESLDALLQRISVLSLRIRPDRLIYEDETVLEEPHADDSIPFALYRDGLRRMDFTRGVTEDDIEILLAATAAGFAFSGLGDDIVSHLWKHDLEHIRYLVVDTSIVEAVADASSVPANAEVDFDGQIDGLLQAIYGQSTDDVGPRAVHLDAADIGAKRIADAIDDIDEMAPGFHPTRRLSAPPAYAAALLEEIQREDEGRVRARAANAALRGLHALDGTDADDAAESLLRMFDAAVMANDLALATRVLAGVQAFPPPTARIQRWLEQALSEARVRHALRTATESNISKDTFVRLFQFLQAGGVAVVEHLLPMLGQFTDGNRRRALTDLAIALGGAQLDQIRAMLDDSAVSVVQEGLHLLNQSRHPEAAQLWTSVEQHRNPLARIALLTAFEGHQSSAALNAVTRLLKDEEARVRIAAAECLGSLKHADVGAVVAGKVESPAFESEDGEFKRALLRAYAQTNGPRAVHILSKTIKRGEGRLVRRETEDLAVHAVLATGLITDRRADELLQRVASSKNKRIRETGRQVLGRRMRS